ncbi:MAG: hypothetical protein LH660_11430, partial [Phormidesmis sp. CAN_BIN36]|nr:hypothetical protein [Phormidesmis sp. CAN_BIN36]
FDWVVFGSDPPVIENHGLTVRSPLKGLQEGLRYSVRFNGLRKASPEFHSRAGRKRSKKAGARSKLMQ